MNSLKKIQPLLYIVAGAGIFLPFLTISAYGESESASFYEIFDVSKLTTEIIDVKIILGVIAFAFILSLIPNRKNGIGLKIFSLLVAIASGVLVYIDIDKISSLKGFLSSMVKYGIGYYMIIAGLGLAILIGIISLFYREKNYGYSIVYDQADNSYSINRPIITNNPVNPSNNPVNDNSNSENQVNPINTMKLSDLINKNKIQSDIKNDQIPSETGESSNNNINN